ncbi:insulin-like growth factor-binding complex acid labile subunit [Brachionus plicatilis]|uniref:Insulin-like growth factor-binding complex acid labile subunit n=1 Tax=Brachionus plicatilis TaxID=10195 RepID=A0A3M7SYQ5_BRAPC|nr:insulin-like growth factor-binding complex acid labile subunit [Brachionus plicatilis]
MTQIENLLLIFILIWSSPVTGKNWDENSFKKAFQIQWEYLNRKPEPDWKFQFNDDSNSITVCNYRFFHVKRIPHHKCYFYLQTNNIVNLVEFCNETKYTYLRVLILSNSSLSSFKCIFSSYLVYIDLSHNEIRHLFKHSFSHMNSLSYLDISSNYLKTIDLIFNLVDFEENWKFKLSLANNTLDNIDLKINPFSRHLYINISNTNTEVWPNLYKAKATVYLDTFNLTIFSDIIVTIDQNFNLSWGAINQARVERISFDQRNMGLREHVSYRKIEGLTEIYFRRNFLKILQKTDVTMYPPKISIIDLSDNLIEYVDPNFFDGCPKLNTLNLRNNRLFSVRHFELRILSLSTLDLSYNLMSSLEYLVLKSSKDLPSLTIYLDNNKLTKIPVIKCQVQTIELISFTNQSTVDFDTFYMNFNGIKNTRRNPLIKKLDLSHNNYLRKVYDEIFCFLGQNIWNNLKINSINLSATRLDIQKIGCLKQLQIGDQVDPEIVYDKNAYAYNESECKYSEDTDCELHAKRVEQLIMVTSNQKGLLDLILTCLIIADFILSVILIKILCLS